MTPIHEHQTLLQSGTPLEAAKAVMILIHGRGDSAQGIMGLSQEFEQPDFAFVAPQAANNTWYPFRFIEPTSRNEPYLSSAIQTVNSILEMTQKHVSLERTFLVGFSQGACLALEVAARHGEKFGGVIAFSGGLIGDTLELEKYTNLEQTPIFLGCSDVDAHIPKARVEESAALLERLKANVTMRLYPNFGHSINADELELARTLIKGSLGQSKQNNGLGQ
jgi:phospholipase/carboxylesterase